MDYVSGLDYEQDPDYDRCRRFFQDALRNMYHLPSADYTKAELLFTNQASSSSSASSAKGRSTKLKAPPSRPSAATSSSAASSASASYSNGDEKPTLATLPKKSSTRRSRSSGTKKAKATVESDDDKPVLNPSPHPRVNGNSRGVKNELVNGAAAQDEDIDEHKAAAGGRQIKKTGQSRRDRQEDPGVDKSDSDGGMRGGAQACASAAGWSNGDNEFKAPREPSRDPLWLPAHGARDSSTDEELPTSKPTRSRATGHKHRSRPSSKAATAWTSERNAETATAARPCGADIIPAVAASASASSSRSHAKGTIEVAEKLKRKSIAIVHKGAALRAAARSRKHMSLFC